ncbi:hypothetical protein EI94DRAFT_1699341 [Lactarius quietus]|nr:hypothetical protein EI94DRAFT_1699341 [Lactarius quietus]
MTNLICVDNEGSVTEEDPMDNEYTIKLALKQPYKFLESLAIEVHPNLVSWAARCLVEPHLPSQSFTLLFAWLCPLGLNKLKLTHKRPMVRAVIQEAIEQLRAMMMFNNAFPEFCVALGLIKDCLFTVANILKPGSAGIYIQLKEDPEYLSRITPLPANYTYTSLKAKIDKMPQWAGDALMSYQNDHIITVIQDMFFTGGAKLFAKHFCYLFPTHDGRDGETVLEVPIPMVALIATALYVAIYNWQTGEQVVTEFSANAFLNAE